jgi:hypothetical protein
MVMKRNAAKFIAIVHIFKLLSRLMQCKATRNGTSGTNGSLARSSHFDIQNAVANLVDL